MGKVRYKKCPRCELNYIPDTEEMCDICKSEMGLESKIMLLDDIIDDDEPLKLCPICKTSYIGMDEEMCEGCLAREKQSAEVDEDDDGWRTYLDDEDTDDVDDTEIPLDELEEDDDFDDDFEDEENMETELDDYPDDILDDFDGDYDDEEEDEEEDENDDM